MKIVTTIFRINIPNYDLDDSGGWGMYLTDHQRRTKPLFEIIESITN